MENIKKMLKKYENEKKTNGKQKTEKKIQNFNRKNF